MVIYVVFSFHTAKKLERLPSLRSQAPGSGTAQSTFDSNHLPGVSLSDCREAKET